MKNLSNEEIKKIFTSNFALANFAIDIGRQVVQGGNFITLDLLILEVKKRAKAIEDPEMKQKIGIA